MSDRQVRSQVSEVPQMPEILERVLLYALDEGKQRMNAGEAIVPFTTMVVRDNVFLETHPGDSAQECFNLAQHTVEGARGANAYALCYDGYIETDNGVKDALIAEGGVPGAPEGYAIGFLYTQQEGMLPMFDTNPSYIGEAPNFMSKLRAATDYSDAEIDGKYIDGVM